MNYFAISSCTMIGFEGSLSTFLYPLPNIKTQNQKIPYKGKWNTFPWDDRKNTHANLVSINYHHRQGEGANWFAHHQYPTLQEKKVPYTSVQFLKRKHWFSQPSYLVHLFIVTISKFSTSILRHNILNS
jgi:hypothetical protein